jgi:predicted nuclease of predicted toxin-antitoxin system
VKFILDESVDYPIGKSLIDGGYELNVIVKSNPSASDEAILKIAEQDRSVIITSDKDFVNCAFAERRSTMGSFCLGYPAYEIQTAPKLF